MTSKTIVLVLIASVAIIAAAIVVHHHGHADLLPWLAAIHGKH